MLKNFVDSQHQTSLRACITMFSHMHQKVPYGVEISQVFVILLYIQARLAQVNLLLQ